MKTETRRLRDAMVEVIAKEREAKGYSRRELCARSGISNSVLQQFEQPERSRDIRSETLARLAAGLETPLWQLVRHAERLMEDWK